MKRALHRLGVRGKLVLAFAGMSFLALGVGGGLALGWSRSALEQEILKRLESEARAQAAEVDRAFALLARRAEDFASDGYLRDRLALADAAASRAELLAHVRENKLPLEPSFRALRLLDSGGTVVVSTDPATATGHGAVGVDEPTTFRIEEGEDLLPSVLLSTPVRELHGEDVLGRLLVVVDATRVLPAPPNSAGARVLVAPDGRELGLGASAIPARTRREAPGDREALREDYPLDEARGWHVAVTLDATSAFLPVLGLRSRLLAAGAVLAALAALLLAVPLRLLIRPLGALQGAAARLREGDFGARVHVEGEGEFADLADGFNRMAQAVQDRTRALELAAQDLKRGQAMLRAERDRLDAVITAMRDGLLVLDAQGRLLLSNRAAAPLARILERPVRDARALHRCRDSAADHHEDCLTCLADPTGPPRSCLVEAGGRRFEIHATTLRDEPDVVLGRVLVARDVSDRIAQDERQIHQERLAVLGEVAAVVAHELNNPLTSIRMYAQMLASEVADRAPLAEDVEVILRNTESCRRTIRELLDYATGASAEVGEIDLHEVLEDVVRFLRPVGDRSGATLTLEADAPDARVTGDEVQLRQVFVNLIMNAIQAVSPAGSVTLRTRCDGDQVSVVVRDDGCGIPEAEQPEVFRPFFTTKPRGEGTGLGLPTARRISEMQGGGLELLHSDPSGTEFEVRLRLRKEVAV